MTASISTDLLVRQAIIEKIAPSDKSVTRPYGIINVIPVFPD